MRVGFRAKSAYLCMAQGQKCVILQMYLRKFKYAAQHCFYCTQHCYLESNANFPTLAHVQPDPVPSGDLPDSFARFLGSVLLTDSFIIVHDLFLFVPPIAQHGHGRREIVKET